MSAFSPQERKLEFGLSELSFFWDGIISARDQKLKARQEWVVITGNKMKQREKK